jgi:hypothetical protein
MKRLGFFSKWNVQSQTSELSMTRLQMFIFTFFSMFFIYQYFITEGNHVDVNSIMLVVTLLLAVYAPKAIKDLTDIKDKIK